MTDRPCLCAGCPSREGCLRWVLEDLVAQHERDWPALAAELDRITREADQALAADLERLADTYEAEARTLEGRAGLFGPDDELS